MTNLDVFIIKSKSKNVFWIKYSIYQNYLYTKQNILFMRTNNKITNELDFN